MMEIEVLVGNDSYAKDLYMRNKVERLYRIWKDDPEKSSVMERVIGTHSLFHTGGIGLCAVQFDEWKLKEQRAFLESLERFENSDIQVFLDVVTKMPSIRIDLKERYFELPKPWEERKWINAVIEIATFLGLRVTTEAARELLKRLGQNKWAIHNELSKLSLLSNEINVDIVEEETPVIEPVQLEELIKSIAVRSREVVPLAFAALEAHDPILIISAIFSLFKDLYLVLNHYDGEPVTWELVKSYSLIFKTSASRVAMLLGYRFKGSKTFDVRPVDLWNEDEVEETIIALQRLEMDVKDGKREPRLGIMELLHTLILGKEVA